MLAKFMQIGSSSTVSNSQVGSTSMEQETSLRQPIRFIRRSFPCSKESGSLCRASSRHEEYYDCSRFGSHEHINKASKEGIRTRSSVWARHHSTTISFGLQFSSS